MVKKLNFEMIDDKPQIKHKDKITLTFEVESDLSDITQTYAVTKAVADFMTGFKLDGKDFPLFNIGVHYEWNKEQKVKQSDEFMKANPDYTEEAKPKKVTEVKTPIQESETEMIMRKMKNGKHTRTKI